MWLLTRRRFIAGALSVTAVDRARSALSAESTPPSGARELWRPGDLDRRIEDFRVFADDSIAVSTVDYSTLPPQGCAYYLDGGGAEKWRTDIGHYEDHEMIGRLARAMGAGPPGLYVASGFKTVLRLAADGSILWNVNLFDELALTTELSLESHPAGGVILGAQVVRPDNHPCDEGLLLRLGADGKSLWYWECNQLGHFFPTALAVTANGVIIAHLTNYDPLALGSAGDLCASHASPQWTLWFDDAGNLIHAYEWPADRRGEAIALDRQGRLVVCGVTRPEGRSFFRMVDASSGRLLFETVLGDDEPDPIRRDRPIWARRRLHVTGRGVGLISTDCPDWPCVPPGASVTMLSEGGRVSSIEIQGSLGIGPALRPDGNSLLAGVDDVLLEIPLTWS